MYLDVLGFEEEKRVATLILLEWMDYQQIRTKLLIGDYK